LHDLKRYVGEGPPLDDGYIEPSVPREQVRQEPYPLPKDFEWSTVDIADPQQVSISLGMDFGRLPFPFCRTRKSMTFFLSITWRTMLHYSDSNIARNSCDGTLYPMCSILTTTRTLFRALMPPGYHKEWHIGVRVSSNKKLVAFISGVPLTLRVRGQCVFLATFPLIL
jgi:glycylpeptide N-tetradecanoyltransferase